MLENTSYISTSVLLLWDGRMVSHATRTEMGGISLVFLVTQHSQRRSLLCQGPDLWHLRGCSVVLGSAPSSRAFQLNRGVKPQAGLSPSQNTCENPGNKCVFSSKGGLGCWSCQCYNCEALLFDCF